MQNSKNYLLGLTELEKAISEGNIETFKKLSNLIELSSNVENDETSRDYYPITRTSLVILACKHNKIEILEYLFSCISKNPKNLSIFILPNDEDETHHNAFYYAIRSGNIDLLDLLINKWPENYFAIHLKELDEILSQAYQELKLKNVLLSDEMEIFVENKLINLRFFSDASVEDESFRSNLADTRERIELVLQNISLLKTDYSNSDEVDERFLFIAKSIAENIHILKQQLKSTYVRLPWEEIEFCLVSFIFFHIKRQEINLFYHAALDKSGILNYLESFANKLKEEKDNIEGVNIQKLWVLPRVKREKVVEEIISNYPQFKDLYNAYQQIRDVRSLDKINNNIKLALSADPKEKEGRLITTRVLQVIGEHLKNTLESPKLSNTTSERLLLSLPRNARKIIVDIRNSLSHAYSLSKRIDMMENSDVNYFKNIQNDLKKVGDVITDILYSNKFKTIKILLNKIVSSENADEIKKVAKVLSTVEFDETILEKFQMMEHERLNVIIKELSDKITDKTNYEKKLLNKINSILNSIGTLAENIRTDYVIGIATLKTLCNSLNDRKTDHNLIKEMKLRASFALQIITPRIESCSLKEIANLAIEVSLSVKSRIPDDQLDEVYIMLICQLFFIAQFGTDNIKWIEKLKEKLNRKGSFISTREQNQSCNLTEEIYNDQLALKLSDLKNILSNNSLIEKLSLYKSDKKLQAVVEMLILDIMSILSKDYLENNQLFLDDATPLLIGKCLRNHLAHDNALVDVLLSDFSIAVILNAKKITKENLLIRKKKIGKLIIDDPSRLRRKFDRDLTTITYQKKMFGALAEGNLEILRDCFKMGSDINARSSINLWTTLHFAAKGPSLECMKFLFDQNVCPNVKDINGESPLHTAATHGRHHIVEFLVKEIGLHVDDINDSGKTPLHLAAQNGHKGAVEVLLRNKASTITHDVGGFLPLHYAIMNNHVDIAKVLLKNDVNVDINEAMGGGFTPLHGAAKSGHLELVNFLLQNKANVNATNDRNWTPLHTAVSNGNLEVMNALILKGANVNDRVVNGCSPLYYAVAYGQEKIANILLKHGANANDFVIASKCTPLHRAANDGHLEIVTILLENRADADVVDVDGITPLHFAAHGGNLEIVAALLKHGVDIHANDKNNATPLHYAVEGGHKEVAALLITNKSKINAKTNINLTPLHLAAREGHKDVADLLIESKAAINSQDIQGNTPLHAAALRGSKDIIDVLIKNEAEVNSRTTDGITPLHVAALNGRIEAINFLIENKAQVNAETDYGRTPLHSAIVGGHKDVVNLLIKNKAQVDVRGSADSSPLHVAVEAGYKEIVEILTRNGANVNVKSKNMTPLLSAVRQNHKEIVKILIANGANVNREGNIALKLAVLVGYVDIVEVFLKNHACVNITDPDNVTLLHLAAKRGHKTIVNILIKKGADVDAKTLNNMTPLYCAALGDYEEVVDILITSGANVNAKSIDGFTPLHIAASSGHNNVVKILLDNKANVNVKDNENITPLELTVSRGHLEVVKMLLKYQKVDIDAKGNDDYTLLHIASQGNNLDMVRYLVKEGSNIDARNASGSKPIHIAARGGFKDTVEFFLSKGLSINDPGAANQTLVHYAAIKGHLEVVKYLIARGADVNAKDTNGLTPMHIAAVFGYKSFIEVLLQNGAVYNVVDKFHRKLLERTDSKDAINLLESTEKLFGAVKRNNSLEVEKYIKSGAFLNAKDNHSGTPLHYAAWKGYEGVIDVLLQYKANPNMVGTNGWTPLHYAVKFSQLKVVKALLSYGAVYNVVSDSGKTPSDFSVDKNISSLFKLLKESFQNVKNGNSRVVHDLDKIEDIDTIKAMMNARNRENKTLVVVAVLSSFPKVEQLKQIAQGDLSTKIDVALVLFEQGNYQKALSIFKSAFEKRKEILGSDNPGTLDIQTQIAKVLYTQGAYQEALKTFEEILQKQIETLGLNEKDTLSTRSDIGLVLHRLGRDEEAFSIYPEVYQRQKEILGPSHSDTLGTQLHMALVLHRQGKYDEALNVNRSIFQMTRDTLGVNHPNVVLAENNIAMVLASQGKYEEALKMYREVLEKKKVILGVNHADTLRTLHNIAGVLFSQKKYREALEAHQKLLNIQKNVLGPNHPDTLNTQYNLANVLYAQGKWTGAMKIYRECLDQIKSVFGSTHPSVSDILKRIERLSFMFNLNCSQIPYPKSLSSV